MSQIRIAVVALLVAWAVFFSIAPLRGLFWTPPNFFELTTDSSLTVVDVDADGPAYRAGLRVGDRVKAATASFEDRLYLMNLRNTAPGRSIVLHVSGKHGWRIVHLNGEPLATDASEYVYYFIGVFIDLTIVLVGSIILLLRPSTMTWAFFLYCVGVLPGLFFISFWLPPWLNFGASAFGDALRSIGYGAFLIFCVRVPNDSPAGRWRYLELLAAPIVVGTLLICNAVIDLSIVGVLHADLIAGRIQTGISSAAYIIGILALIATLFRERGRERNRIAWIVVGFAIGLGSIAGANFANLFAPLFPPIPGPPSWLQFMPAVLPIAIPLTVAYAVVRHHALDAGFIAKRTLVYGLLLTLGLAAFVMLDVLVTKRLANNEFEVGVDIALALAIGLMFQFFHPRAIRMFDRVFLPERYQAAIALDRLRTTLGRVGNDNGPNRTVETVAEAFKLSSLAIFEKISDGGFVRYAASGWPKGSAWHILSGDQIVRLFGSRTPVRSVNETDFAHLRFPEDLARPIIGILKISQTAVLILVGSHENGRRPDHDEVRGIASLLSEFTKAGTEIAGLPSSPATRRNRL